MRKPSKKPPEPTAARSRLKPIKSNYILYNTLSAERRAVFFEAGLGVYLSHAERALFGSRNRTTYNASRVTEPLYSTKKAALINIYIEYALSIIAIFNPRFGVTADEQHEFFNRTAEQEVFFTYLFAGMQQRKRDALGDKVPEDELKFPYVGDNYQSLEGFNTKRECFKVRGKVVSEREIFAAGIFYAVNFIFDAVEKRDTARIKGIKKDFDAFGLGTSYRAAHGKKGGIKSNREKVKNRERAYQLFVDNKIYIKGGCYAALCEDLMPILKKAGIKAAPTTVEKKWIPDFIGRQEKKSLDLTG